MIANKPVLPVWALMPHCTDVQTPDFFFWCTRFCASLIDCFCFPLNPPPNPLSTPIPPSQNTRPIAWCTRAFFCWKRLFFIWFYLVFCVWIISRCLWIECKLYTFARRAVPAFTGCLSTIVQWFLIYLFLETKIMDEGYSNFGFISLIYSPLVT